MTLRRIPGALALGLLASLLAHAGLYGGGHEMGGTYHAWLVELAAAGSLGLLIAAGALAWTGSRRIADGSVLSARLAALLPTPGTLGGAAALWFALGERIEASHADAGLVATLAVLAIAAWVILTLARGCLQLLSAVAVAVARPGFARRTPRWVRRHATAPVARRSPWLRRRFARPPPVANACA